MEKNKKIVICLGGSRGELEEVKEVVIKGSIEEYLDEFGKDYLKEMLRECEGYDEDDMLGVEERIEEFRIGIVDKLESSKGLDVYGMSLEEEECLYVFEGEESDLEDVESVGDLYDYLGI
jgi:methanogenic corrinoid protein MtbC1